MSVLLLTFGPIIGTLRLGQLRSVLFYVVSFVLVYMGLSMESIFSLFSRLIASIYGIVAALPKRKKEPIQWDLYASSYDSVTELINKYQIVILFVATTLLAGILSSILQEIVRETPRPTEGRIGKYVLFLCIGIMMMSKSINVPFPVLVLISTILLLFPYSVSRV